jgi:hypothetical protein
MICQIESRMYSTDRRNRAHSIQVIPAICAVKVSVY